LILRWLKALSFSDTEARRREVGELIAGDYGALLCTLGPDEAEYAAALSPTGNRALLVRVPGLMDHRLFRLWDTERCLPASDEIELPQGLYFQAVMIDERSALVRYEVDNGLFESARILFDGRPRVEIVSESVADQTTRSLDQTTLDLRPLVVGGRKRFPAGVLLEVWPEDKEPWFQELRIRSARDNRLLIEPIALGCFDPIGLRSYAGDLQAQVAVDGSRLVTLESRRVRVWSLPRPDRARIAEPITVVTAAFNGTGTKLAAIVLSGVEKRAELRVLDVASGTSQSRPIEDGHGHALEPASSKERIEFSADDRAIVLRRSDGDTLDCVFDVATGTHLFPEWSFRPAVGANERDRHAIAFSPQLDKVVTAESQMEPGGVGYIVRVWDIARGRPLTPPIHAYVIDSVVFSRNGKTVALHLGEHVSIWSSRSRRLLQVELSVVDDEGGVHEGMKISQDGRRVLVQDKRSWKVDVVTGHRRALTASEEARQEWSSDRVKRYAGWVDVNDRRGVPRARYLPALVALRMTPECELCAQIAAVSGDRITAHNRNLAEAEAPPVVGEPSALLVEWSRKLTGH
jgi:hypothetical protein